MKWYKKLHPWQQINLLLVLHPLLTSNALFFLCKECEQQYDYFISRVKKLTDIFTEMSYNVDVQRSKKISQPLKCRRLKKSIFKTLSILVRRRRRRKRQRRRMRRRIRRRRRRSRRRRRRRKGSRKKKRKRKQKRRKSKSSFTIWSDNIHLKVLTLTARVQLN